MSAPSHLDDETLSALLDEAPLDGEAATGGGHARTCGDCGARLEALRGVSIIVGGVPVLEGGLRDALVTWTLDAVDGDEPAGRRVRPQQRWVTAFGVAAAVALALGVGAVLVGRPDGGGGGEPFAASTEDRAGTEERATAAGVAPPVDGGDLGEIAGAAALHARVAREFGAAPRASAESDAGLTRGAPAPCAAEAAALAPSGSPLSYRARATSKGRALVIIGFGPPSRAPAVLLALDEADCEVVVFARQGR